jgi:hypothetical protein
MSETYSQGPVRDYFGEGEVCGFGVKVAFYNLEVGGDGA